MAQVVTRGFSDLRRAFRKIDRDLRLALDRELRAAANPIRDRSRQLLRERSRNPRGQIERTIRVSVTQGGVSVYTNHPGAPVNHWGGTIRPRGAPITFERKHFIGDAAEEAHDDVVERMDELLDGIANRAGFTGP